MRIFRRTLARTQCIGCGSTAIRYLWIDLDALGDLSDPGPVEHLAVCAPCQAAQQCAVTIRFPHDLSLPPYFADLIARRHVRTLDRIARRRSASARNRVFRPSRSPEPICLHRAVPR